MRDNFPSQVIETLKKRAAFICSNPACKKMTVGPSTESDDKIIYFGRAAHICGASINGPRYDKNMTPEERVLINNAIFLCSNCADIIDDNNGLDYPRELLHEWKSAHEVWVRESLNKSVQGSTENVVVNFASSYNQIGGITANHVNIGIQPRIIPIDSVNFFISEITTHITTINRIRIRTYFGDAECQNLSTQINNCFERAGWTITGHSFEIPNQAMHGVYLGVPKSDEKSKTALTIYNWLVSNNLKVKPSLVDDSQGYMIWVGQNV